MLRLLRQFMGRVGLAGAVVMAIAFATPAFASHTCANDACAPAGQSATEAPSDTDDACPDCGPACANGCCHAPHPSTTPPQTIPPLAPQNVAGAEAWLQQAALPLLRIAGPDRPPRA